MRHRNRGRHFSRTSSHRLQLLRNLSISIVKYGVICTTIFKAKEVRMYLEKLITKAKVDTIANRRFLFSKLNNRESVYSIFTDVVCRFKSRNGGYLRILKLSKSRSGDSAPLALVGFVDRV